MEAIATAISDDVTTTALFGVVAGLAALIVTGILVSFGLNRGQRVIGGLGRGKAKV